MGLYLKKRVTFVTYTHYFLINVVVYGSLKGHLSRGIEMVEQRGIKDAAKVGQIVDFKGMMYGACSPTDIDLSIDFRGDVFVFVEFKYKGFGLTTGQKIHLLGLVDAIEKGGKDAYAILAHHNGDEHIQAADCLIDKVYSGGNWERFNTTTLHDFVSEIHKSYMLKRKNR